MEVIVLSDDDSGNEGAPTMESVSGGLRSLRALFMSVPDRVLNAALSASEGCVDAAAGLLLDEDHVQVTFAADQQPTAAAPPRSSSSSAPARSTYQPVEFDLTGDSPAPDSPSTATAPAATTVTSSSVAASSAPHQKPRSKKKAKKRKMGGKEDVSHIVQAGETLKSVAELHSVNIDDLIEANRLLLPAWSPDALLIAGGLPSRDLEFPIRVATVEFAISSLFIEGDELRRIIDQGFVLEARFNRRHSWHSNFASVALELYLPAEETPPQQPGRSSTVAKAKPEQQLVREASTSPTPHTCGVCNRVFGSARAREQHQKDKGHRQGRGRCRGAAACDYDDDDDGDYHPGNSDGDDDEEPGLKLFEAFLSTLSVPSTVVKKQHEASKRNQGRLIATADASGPMAQALEKLATATPISKWNPNDARMEPVRVKASLVFLTLPPPPAPTPSIPLPTPAKAATLPPEASSSSSPSSSPPPVPPARKRQKTSNNAKSESKKDDMKAEKRAKHTSRKKKQEQEEITGQHLCVRLCVDIGASAFVYDEVVEAAIAGKITSPQQNPSARFEVIADVMDGNPPEAARMHGKWSFYKSYKGAPMLILMNALSDSGAVRQGNDSCGRCLNGLGGKWIPKGESTAHVGGVDALLGQVARTDDEMLGMGELRGTPLACETSMLSTPKPYQRAGVRWMEERERFPDNVTLHPAWHQMVTADGQLLYYHRVTGHLSRRFFVAPRAGTCGGFLCDEVGLGKSLQVLSLVLSHPAPEGWAVSTLPSEADKAEIPIPIKTTLIVVPSALLQQWEQEVKTHMKPSSLKYCTYLGLTNPFSPTAASTPRAGKQKTRVAAEIRSLLEGSLHGASGVASSSSDSARRSRRSAAAGPGRNDRRVDDKRQILAQTLPWIIKWPDVEGQEQVEEQGGEKMEDGAKVINIEQEGTGTGSRSTLADCDVMFVSYETLRDELRQSNSATLELKGSPLAQLGFWRVVLDEAQLVSNTNSKAAILCSALWRRHAWVVTGTPVNSSMDEVKGLLEFLDHRPFSESSTYQHLIEKLNGSGLSSSRHLARQRLVTLLKGLMLRRTKAAVTSQLQLPPLKWEVERLVLSPAEQASYQVAIRALKNTYTAWERATVAANRRQGQHSSLTHNNGRRQGLTGRLNGDLTRVRQTICHPRVVNTQNQRGGLEVTGMTHRQILGQLVSRAFAEYSTAKARLIRAQAVKHVSGWCADGQIVLTAPGLLDLLEQMLAKLELVAQEKAEHDTARPATLVADYAAETARRGPNTIENVRNDMNAVIAWVRRKSEDHPGDNDDVMIESDIGASTRGSGQKAGSSGVAVRVKTGGRISMDGRRLGERSDGGKTEATRLVNTGERAVVEKLSQLNFLKEQQAAADSEKQSMTLAREVPSTSATTSDQDLDEMDTQPLEEDDDKAEGKPKMEDQGIGDADMADAHEEEDVCIICLDVLEKTAPWIVTSCGHSFCPECIQSALEVQQQCPLCKTPLTSACLFKCDPVLEAAPPPDPSVSDFGTKVAALMKEVGGCCERGEKMVVFSAWQRLLQLTREALESQGVVCASLAGGTVAKQAALAEFRTSKVSVLLVPLFGGSSGAGGGGAAGLTLTEATVAVLMEPALQPGIERQAAGRIHRVGQTRSTRCIRLIVEDTIEDRILEWSTSRLNDGVVDGMDTEMTLNEVVKMSISDDWKPSRQEGSE